MIVTVYIFRLTELQSVGRAGVLRVAGHAAVARVGEGVVVLVHHGEARAPVEVICCEAVLQQSGWYRAFNFSTAHPNCNVQLIRE